MPAINRIRIVNILYDGRVISDCLFDYYGGRSALMNLANGCGKTVMVESIFQPVIPGMDIGGWKITDYVTGDQKPSYVMIEWLLDGTKTPSYFLTGICLSKTVVQGDDDRKVRSLKYFNFVYDYSYGNEYDIAHIPVSEMHGDVKKYYTYDEFQENLKKYKRSHEGFDVFVSSKRQEYQKYLMQRRIYEYEWKLLARVNQAESGNGLAALFQNCKTSDELFDKWILKTVSDINKEQRQSLINETAALIKPMIASSRDIADKKLMEDVYSDLLLFGNTFREHTEELDKKEGKERYIAGTLKHTKACIKAEERKAEEAALVREECRRTESKIRHEELSEQFYDIETSISESSGRLKEYEAAIPGLEEKYCEAEYKRDCMRAAEYYGKLKAAREKYTAAKNTIETIGNNETAARKKQLGAAIYDHYFSFTERQKKAQSDLREELCNRKNERDRLGPDRSRLENELSELNMEIGRLRDRCGSFAETEAAFEKKIGELPDRDLTGELTKESIDRISERLAGDIAAAEQLKDKLESEIVRLKAGAEENDSALDQNSLDINRQTLEVNNAGLRNDALEKAAAETAEVLRRYDIDKMHLYEREENLKAVREKYYEADSLYRNDIRERDRLNETRDKLRRGELHTAKEFAELLTQNGIEYQTGESFLKKQDGVYFDGLLARDPLLPYCFIVTDRDHNRALEISQEYSVDRICPVISRSALETELKAAEYSADLGVLTLYGIYNRESLHPDTRDKYISRLESTAAELDNRINKGRKRLDDIADDLHIIDGFSFSEAESREIRSSFAAAREKLAKLETCRSALETEKANISSELEEAVEKLSANEKLVAECRAREDTFREYLARAEKDLRNREELSAAEGRRDEVRRSIELILKKTEELSGEISEAEVRLNTMQRDIGIYESKAAEHAAFAGIEPVSDAVCENIRSIEIEFAELNSIYEGSVREQERICRDAQEIINENKDRLEFSFGKLSAEDYDIAFDAGKLDELEKAERAARDALVNCRNDRQNEENEYGKLVKLLKKKEQELSKNGFGTALEKTCIIGRYDERRRANEEKLEKAQAAEAWANDALRAHNSLSNRLEKLIDFDLLLDDSSVKPITDEINIDELRDDLNASKAAVREKQKRLRKEFDRLTGRYKGDAQWIGQMLSFIDIDSCGTYIECFRIYEQLLDQKKLLEDNIKVLSAQLAQIENDKKHITVHMRKHAEFLYDQIRSITAHSSIRINGRSKKIMQISIPDALDSGYQERVKLVVDETLSKLTNAVGSEGISDDDLLRKVNTYFTDRLLFNAVTGSNSVEIKVWKSLKDERSSRLEKWESRYSGGEHFLVYFVVYTALVTYARRRQDVNDNEEIRSVFLIDNPFGETSSEHLLDVFVGIANKFKLQAICFSDLKQDSITKNFELIYQMSLREAAYSNRSYLTVDEILNNAGAEPDTQLEYVSMNSQLSFI